MTTVDAARTKNYSETCQPSSVNYTKKDQRKMRLPCSVGPRLEAALQRPCIAQGRFVQSRRFSKANIANAPPSRDGRTDNARSEADGDGFGAALGGGTAIVSGGSRGIGLAIASRLAQHGISCTLVGRNEEKLQAAVETVSQAAKVSETGRTSATCRYVLGDVRDEATWATLFKNTVGLHYSLRGCNKKKVGPLYAHTMFFFSDFLKNHSPTPAT